MSLYLASRTNHLKKILTNFFALQKMPQADRWLVKELAQNKKFGSKDRKWYSEQFFLIIRNLYAIIYNEHFKDLGIENFKNEISNPQKFWNFVQNTKVESCLFHLETGFENLDSSNNEFIKNNIPLWLEPHLKDRYQNLNQDYENFDIFLQHLCHRPLLWIRINHANKTNEVLSNLKSNEYTFEQSDFPETFKIFGNKSILNLDSFKNGLFEIQDYASQCIGRAIEIHPNQNIWDACAGGGGKTLQIASLLNNSGTVFASDIRSFKLEELKNRANRAQFLNIQTFEWDAIQPFNNQKTNQNIKNFEGFDRVLVDAPCTSSGTWGRNPDAKYKIGLAEIEQSAHTQLSILNSVCSSVKHGGKLIYATCSVFEQENESVVHLFLNNHSNFKLCSMSIVGNQNSDTMFVAVMENL